MLPAEADVAVNFRALLFTLALATLHSVRHGSGIGTWQLEADEFNEPGRALHILKARRSACCLALRSGLTFCPLPGTIVCGYVQALECRRHWTVREIVWDETERFGVDACVCGISFCPGPPYGP